MTERTANFFRMSMRFWGLITAAGLVACAATLFGFLGRFSWFLDLFSHFRVQYLIGLSILAALFRAGRRRGTALVFLGFACVNLGIILPLYFGGRDRVPDGTHTLRAMLINVNTRLGNPERVKQAVLEADPDILVLEEISSKWVHDLAWLANSHPHSVIQPREDNFGIGLFSKLALAGKRIVCIGCAEVPSIVATLDVGRDKLNVIATHPLPPVSADYFRCRNDQLERLPDFVNCSVPLILLGDLNVTPWNYRFRRLLKRAGLMDSSQGRGVRPTWPNFNPLLLIPIDHCLYSPGIAVVGRQTGSDVGSDHYPVIVDFAIR